MSLEEVAGWEIDPDLLKGLSSKVGAFCIISKFEKYSGKNPTELDFYKVYLKYVKYKNLYGGVFNSYGTIKKSALHSLNSPKFKLNQFKVIENYLFYKKIISEKIFDK